MAQCRESGGNEGCGGGGADGNADALKDRSLALLGDAVVLDVRLDVVEEDQSLVHVGRRLLQRRQERIRLLQHGRGMLITVRLRGVRCCVDAHGVTVSVHLVHAPT